MCFLLYPYIKSVINLFISLKTFSSLSFSRDLLMLLHSICTISNLDQSKLIFTPPSIN